MSMCVLFLRFTGMLGLFTFDVLNWLFRILVFLLVSYEILVLLLYVIIAIEELYILEFVGINITNFF